MQQYSRSILCRSERGFLAVLNHGLAYSFTFKNVHLVLAADEVDTFRHSLEGIDEREWIIAPETSFTLLPIPRANVCVWLTRSEVDEMIALLREAAAMIKVHQRLLNRV